jgi:nucleoside-diphosphate-sugar epimerase
VSQSSGAAERDRFPASVLVVGGAGYIGSVLVRDLLSEGYRVRVLDSLLFGEGSLQELFGRPRFELLPGDFRRLETVVRAVRGVDAVIHLGGIVGDPACALNEDETLEINLGATQMLIDVCRGFGVRRLLFASSCSVYGSVDRIVDEQSQVAPASLYAATKSDSEKLLWKARDHSFQPVILRLATAFGWSYRLRFDLVVNLLTAKAAIEKKIVIYNRRQWRPFIHVSDISRAFRLALSAPLDLSFSDVFNVGSNRMNFTLQELAERICGLEPGLEVEFVDNSDPRNYRVCFDKIRERFDFECSASLEDGIRSIQQALRSGTVSDYRSARYHNLQFLLEQQQAGLRSNGSIELASLRFAERSRWKRALAAGYAPEALVQEQSTGMAGLAGGVSAPLAAPPHPNISNEETL